MTAFLTRRNFAAGSAALALAGCTNLVSRPIAGSAAPTCLPRLDVAPDRVIRSVAGLRPYRRSGYRVEIEAVGEKRVVHNYGHGGGGISLSWGSSREALALGLPGHSGPVAVLGAGALGLTCARLLQEAGYQANIYAKALPPNTTSNIAGGQILPSTHFEREHVTEEWLAKERLAADYTRRRMQIDVGEDYGIRWIATYDQGHRTLRPDLRPFYPGRESLAPDAHPFPADRVDRYMTMYVETGRWLASLLRDVRIAGGGVAVREFRDRTELATLSETLIFNCTGLGSHELFGDEVLEPVRGQLAILIPQPEVQYAYSASPGYMFPRPDGIVLGGTFEHGEWQAEPQPEDIAAIVERHRDWLSGWRCGAQG